MVGLHPDALPGLGALGIELTQAEQNSLYQYWHYIAYLLGLEDSYYGTSPITTAPRS